MIRARVSWPPEVLLQRHLATRLGSTHESWKLTDKGLRCIRIVVELMDNQHVFAIRPGVAFEDSTVLA